MRQRNARNSTERHPDLIDFHDLAAKLRITQGELVKLIAMPGFPPKVDDHRRGRWRKSDIEAWLRRAQQFQAQSRAADNDGPRAA